MFLFYSFRRIINTSMMMDDDEYVPLQHSIQARRRAGRASAELDVLLSVGQVLRELPAGSCTVNSKVVLEAADKNAVVDGIKGCRNVQTDQRGCLLVVGSSVDAVHLVQKCGFCRVPMPVSRL